MSTPERARRPEVRRDARRVASSASQMQLTRDSSSPDAENVVRLTPAHPELLADRWRAATSFESIRGRAFADPTFADFAALGDTAVSVALDRLMSTDEPELWLDVLEEIADGPRPTGTVDQQVDAWKRWAHGSRLTT